MFNNLKDFIKINHKPNNADSQLAMPKILSVILFFVLLHISASAQSNLTELKKELIQGKNENEKIEILLDIAKIFYSSSIDSAKWYSKQAILLAKENSLEYLFHKATVSYATYVVDSQDTLDVKNDILEAINFQENNGLEKELALSYNVLGNYHFGRNELEKALTSYQKSIDYEEKTGSTMDMAFSKFNLGFLLQKMDRFEEAYENMKFGYTVIKAEKDTGRWIRSSLSLSDLFYNKSQVGDKINNLDSSIFYAREGLALAYHIDFDYAEMRGLGSLMVALADRGDCQEVLDILSEIRKNYSHFLNSAQIQLNLLKEGKAYICIGNADLAINTLNQLLKPEFVFDEVYLALAQAYELKSDFEQSLKYYKEYQLLHDSVLLNRNKVRLSEVQTKYETEKKDNEIATLSQQAQIQALEISQRNTQLIGAGVILILLVIGGFLFYQQRQFRHQQAVSNMEQRLLRLQMNPHFIFNALAAIQSYIIQSNTKESISYLAKFGRLMRQILELSREEFISISEEADMLRNYLEIQQLRYQNRFDFRIEIDESIDEESTSIPPMFAQPFVENAIEHGLKEKLSDGMIIVRFKSEGTNIRLEVEDNGSGLVTKASSNKHKSLATVIGKERLKSLSKRFKTSYELTVQNAEQTGTLAQVLLPKMSQ